jgi:hypothetical protein
MSLSRTVTEFLSKHVTREVEGIDQPRSQTDRGVAAFSRGPRGYTFSSSARMDPISNHNT